MNRSDSTFSRFRVCLARVCAGTLLFLSFHVSATAGVYLTQYSFRAADFVQVYTNESLPSPYKLRVKIMGVPGYGDGYHAANYFNNNYGTISAYINPGTYFTDLYWLKYASDYSTLLEVGPSSSAYVTILDPDATPPSVPANLSAANLSQTSFTLSWSASSDNVGVSGYDVYRNGTWIGWTSTTTLSVTTLTPGTTYAMTVKARDAAWNVSAASTALNVTTLTDNAAPSVPAGLTYSELTQSSVTLTWNASTDNVGVTGYEVFRGGTSQGTVTGTAMNVTGLTPATTYSFTVRARDGSGNWSGNSAAVSITTTPPDTTAPTAPTTLIAANVSSESLTLNWGGATDNIGVTGYEIYKNGFLLGTVGATTTLAVNALSPSTVYQFSVRARDFAGNWSPLSQLCTVKTWKRYLKAMGAIEAWDNYDENGNYLGSSSSTDWYGLDWYTGGTKPAGTLRFKLTTSDWVRADIYTTSTQFTLYAGQTIDVAVSAGWQAYVSMTGNSDGDYGSYSVTADFRPLQVAPTAAIYATPASGRAPLTVTFNGGGSSDDGPIAGYTWDFDSNGSVDARGVNSSYSYGNAGGSPITYTAKLTVTDLDGLTANTTKAITVYPASSSAVSVQSGTASVPYQVPGSTVTLTAAASGQTFKSWVIVSGTGTIASANSATTTLTIGSGDLVVQATYNDDPSIVTQPAPVSVAVGQPVSLGVLATSNSPLSYQWRKDGTNIAGATAAEYYVPISQINDSGSYTVVVTSAAGSIVSNAATVAVNAPVRLALQYWRANDYPGIAYNGHYESQEVWVDSHWDWSSYTDWGLYNWWSSNGYPYHDVYAPDGTYLANEWDLNVDYSYSWNEGHYEWQDVWVEDHAPDGVYGSRWDTALGDFNISNPRSGYVPELRSRGVIGNTYSVGNTFYFKGFQQNVPNGNYVFDVILYGPTGTQWNQHTFSGSSGNLMQLTFNTSGVWRVDIQYRDNVGGSLPRGIVSYYIPVGISAPTALPTVTTQPAPATQTAAIGTTVSYTVAASNAVTYQWLRNGAVVPGASTATLNLSNIQAASAGDYLAVVANAVGSVSSTKVSLATNAGDGARPQPPTALNYATNTATTITLVWRAAYDNVAVVGYNVYRGGTLIGTTSELTFTDSGLSPSTVYNYTVKAFDGAGGLSDASGQLSVMTTADFSADADHDGIPDITETALGTSNSSAASADSSNQTQQNIHRPAK